MTAPSCPVHGWAALRLGAAPQRDSPPGPGGGDLSRRGVRLVVPELGAGLLAPSVIFRGIRVLLLTLLRRRERADRSGEAGPSRTRQAGLHPQSALPSPPPRRPCAHLLLWHRRTHPTVPPWGPVGALLQQGQLTLLRLFSTKKGKGPRHPAVLSVWHQTVTWPLL